MRLSASAPHSK